jgi:hypothetical protein
MEKSSSIKELASAMNKAQSEMSGAKKGALNPFFKKNYADLNSVVDAVRIPFSDNGLSYSQFPLFEEGRVGVETILMHESGEWISSVLMLPMVKQDPQAAGSAITYARRYALQSIAGIPSEDDDGQGAMAGKTAAPVVQLVTDSQAANILALLEEVGADKVKFLAYFKVDCVGSIPTLHFKTAIKMLEQKRVSQ